MHLQPLLRLFFIVYCIEAGFFLLFGPWGPGWEHTVVVLPSHLLRTVLLHPLFRGAVSGFGLVHLVWSTHDLTGSIARRLNVDIGQD